MNPQERAVIDGIFERLRNVANQPRDPEVERYIADLVRQQPYAPYAMAQSIYVQEQALLNQQQQIEQLQAENARLQQQAQAPAQPQSGGFLSGLFGGGQQRQPAEPPAYGQRNREMAAAPAAGPWGGQQPQPQRQGMGFLGTAAAAAAGVAGGMMLGSILSSALGGGAANAATSGANNLFGGNTSGNQNAGQAAQGSESQPQEPGYDNAGYDDGGYDAGFDDGGDSYDV